MLHSVSHPGRAAFAAACGTDAIGAVVSSRLLGDDLVGDDRVGDDWAAALATGPARRDDRVPPPVFAAAAVAPAACRAVMADGGVGNVDVDGPALARNPGLEAPDAGSAAEGQGIRAAVGRLVEPLAVGLTVFTVGVAAFMAMFAWWILVVEPSPGIRPQTHVTMPLFPQGYHLPANQHRG